MDVFSKVSFPFVHVYVVVQKFSNQFELIFSSLCLRVCLMNIAQMKIKLV